MQRNQVYRDVFGEEPARPSFHGDRSPFPEDYESPAQRDTRQQQRKGDGLPRNYNDWSEEQKALWLKKPIEETERYYINLCSYITNLRVESETNSKKLKPYALIKKKKLWRNGLLEILSQHPVTRKHYQTKKRNNAVAPSGLTVDEMRSKPSSSATDAAPRWTAMLSREAKEALALQRQRKSRQEASQMSDQDQSSLSHTSDQSSSDLTCRESLGETDEESEFAQQN